MKSVTTASRKQSTPRALQDKTFVLLLGVVTLAFAWILQPFRGAILWASIFAILFAPLYGRISRSLRGRPTLAALVTVLVVLFVVICPFVLVTAMALQEVIHFYERVQSGDLNIVMQPWVSDMLERLDVTSLAAVQERISAGLRENVQFVASHALAIWQDILAWIANFLVMHYLLFFLLRDGAALVARVSDAIPLRQELITAFAGRLAAVIRATAKGNVLTAAVQGALGGLAFWALGIPGAVFWSVAMAFFALLPVVGAGLVWVPAAVYLLATGATWKGIALAAYGVLVISSADNALRPLLVGKVARLPDYVVLLATLGGMAVFGFDGVVVGPIIAALFIAAWNTARNSRCSTTRAHPCAPHSD